MDTESAYESDDDIEDKSIDYFLKDYSNGKLRNFINRCKAILKDRNSRYKFYIKCNDNNDILYRSMTYGTIDDAINNVYDSLNYYYSTLDWCKNHDRYLYLKDKEDGKECAILVQNNNSFNYTDWFIKRIDFEDKYNDILDKIKNEYNKKIEMC
jgi:hypothetical protein